MSQSPHPNQPGITEKSEEEIKVLFAGWYELIDRKFAERKAEQQHCRIGRQFRLNEDKRTESYL